MSLPSGYKRLEYIQSSGTQYIDTGFKPNQNTRIVIDFAVISLTVDSGVYGARVSGNTACFLCFARVNGTQFTVRYGNKYAYVDAPGGSTIGRFTIDQNKNVVTVNESVVAFDNANFQSQYNAYLLAVNTSDDSKTSKDAIRMYSCKIYDNDVIVRDFVPCQKPDGTIGLWDDVNSLFYGNAGTGTFTAGPAVASPSIFVNIDGIWKPINHIYVNINNIWQKST